MKQEEELEPNMRDFQNLSVSELNKILSKEISSKNNKTQIIILLFIFSICSAGLFFSHKNQKNINEVVNVEVAKVEKPTRGYPVPQEHPLVTLAAYKETNQELSFNQRFHLVNDFKNILLGANTSVNKLNEVQVGGYYDSALDELLINQKYREAELAMITPTELEEIRNFTEDFKSKLHNPDYFRYDTTYTSGFGKIADESIKDVLEITSDPISLNLYRVIKRQSLERIESHLTSPNTSDRFKEIVLSFHKSNLSE